MGRGLLFIVTGLVFVFGMVQHSLNKRQYAISERSTTYAEQQQARNIASSLAERGIEEFFGNTAWQADGKNYGGSSGNGYLGGEGSINTTDRTANAVTIKTTGEYGDYGSYEINVRLVRRAFSYYSYFSNFEPTIYFATGDVIRGPLHSNSAINVAGDPVFEGKVTSTEDMNIVGDPEFKEGFEKLDDPIPLPDDLSELENAANNGGLRFNEDIYTVFDENTSDNNDGQVTVYRKVRSGWRGYYWGNPQTYDLSDYNGVLSSSGSIRMKGKLDGKVTVHSEDDVKIMGDMTYSVDPRDKNATNPADDMLGIISQKDVRVDDNAHRDNGSEDINIHGSVMALGESFQVDEYNRDGKKGTIHLLGGIQQETRGPVGTGYRNWQGDLILTNGYFKDYRYDLRFARTSPPFFPTTQRYEIAYWEEINHTIEK